MLAVVFVCRRFFGFPARSIRRNDATGDGDGDGDGDTIGRDGGKSNDIFINVLKHWNICICICVCMCVVCMRAGRTVHTLCRAQEIDGVDRSLTLIACRSLRCAKKISFSRGSMSLCSINYHVTGIDKICYDFHLFLHDFIIFKG